MKFAHSSKVLAAALMALSLGLTGCLTDSDDDEGKPVITSQPTNVSVADGDSATFTVVAEGDAQLSYKWVRSIGSQVDTLADTTASISFSVDFTMDQASFVCIVSNAKGSVMSDPAKINLLATAWTADTALTVGAQGHLTLGTAVDLDAKRVMLSAVVNDAANAYANMRSIDMLFVFSGDSTRIMSAVAAKAATDVPLADNYIDSVITDVMFVRAPAAVDDWTAGAKLYAEGTKVNSAAVAAGDIFIVKTNLENYVMVRVGTITNGTSSTASTELTVNLKQL